jgi:hypothetical protein
VISVSRHSSWDIGFTYWPSILVEKWTPGMPCGVPALPRISPRATDCPVRTATSARYDTEALRPGTGSTVTVSMPATDPAKVTLPEAGDRTISPGVAS